MPRPGTRVEPIRTQSSSHRRLSRFVLGVAITFCGILAGSGQRARAQDLPQWEEMPRLPFSAASIAYDSARGRTVLFGDYGGTADTWEWDGIGWKVVATTGPSARTAAPMVYDSMRGRTVLFGGSGSSGGCLSDTWEWDGNAWRRVATTGPSARAASMVYDSTRGRTVLFGGYSCSSSPLSDTWEWDGNAWKQVATGGPPAHVWAAMAYDSARGRTVLFGGYPAYGGGLLSDTWEWDGNAWKQVATTGPPARACASMDFDCARGKTVLFGGSGGSDLSDTWEWDGSAWTQVAKTGPPASHWASMAYDSARGRTILFGGSSHLSDTWEWDGSAWKQIAYGTRPAERCGASMAYDSARGRTVIFGGYYYNNGWFNYGDTWEWEGNTWQQVSVSGPPAGDSIPMAFDSARGKTVLFQAAATWEWDGIVWKQVATSGPPARASATMAYDSARRKTVLFGGTNYNGYFSDTWEWDGNAWKQVATSGPPARYRATMSYDCARGMTVLFGGENYNGYFSDTWEWDGNAWKQVATGGPPARSRASMAFDSERGRTVLFGGSGHLIVFADTWEWDGTGWKQVDTAGPSAREWASLAYDSARGRAVLFGGRDAYANGFGDTWEYKSSSGASRQPARAVLESRPSLLLAGGTATLYLSLNNADGSPLAGHTVRFISARGSVDVFTPATVVTSPVGVTAATLQSSLIGSTTVLCVDETIGNLLNTHTSIMFADPAKPVVMSAVLEHQKYPSYTKWVQTASTVDGNPVRIHTSVSNHLDVAQTVKVAAHDGASSSDPLLPAPASRNGKDFPVTTTVTVPARSTVDAYLYWDTAGYAWDNSGNPHSPRQVTVSLSAADIVQDSATLAIEVRPKPMVLVHGFSNKYDKWAAYLGPTGFPRTLGHPEWDCCAVGDGQAAGVMDMGEWGWFNLTNVTNTIWENAIEMRIYIDGIRQKLNAWQVDVVAHSMGGLVSRDYIQDYMPHSIGPDNGRPIVCHLQMLGTPNQGAWEAWLDPITGMWPAVAELQPNSVADFNTKIMNRNGVIWRAFRGNFKVPGLGYGDGVVPIDSAWYTSVAGEQSEMVIGHSDMPGDDTLFRLVVKPALAIGPIGARMASPAEAPEQSRQGRRDKDTQSTLQFVYKGSASIPANGSQIVSFVVPACTTLTVAVSAPTTVTTRLKDASGALASEIIANSPSATPMGRFHSVSNPGPGQWTLEIGGNGTAGFTAGVSAFVEGTALKLTLQPPVVGSDRRVALAATILNGTAPVLGATVTARLTGARGGLAVCTLYDDGLHGDGAANDGTYGASTMPLVPDSYLVQADATGAGFSRGTTGFVVVPGALPPARLAFVSQPWEGNAGMVFGNKATVQVEDLDSNPVPFSGPVTIAIQTGTGLQGAVLKGTTTVNAVNGIATFTDLSIDRQSFGNVLIANSGGLSTAQSLAFDVYGFAYTMADAATAMRWAGGLFALPSVYKSAYNVETGGPSAWRVDISDAIRIARKAAGPDANP